MRNIISEKKQKMLANLHDVPLTVGDLVTIIVDECKTDVHLVSTDPLKVEISENRMKCHKIIKKSDIIGRPTYRIGANPFIRDDGTVRTVNFPLGNIITHLIDEGEGKYDILGVKVAQLNWNPYVYDSVGKKEFYQRPFVWNLETKQNLIESIYQNVSCGRILIRERSWDDVENLIKSGETDVSFFDIVDAKQRLNAVLGFINGEYPDLHGNYYGDLSSNAQHEFRDTQMIGYAEMKNVSDSDVIRQFLKVNFAGAFHRLIKYTGK